MHRAVHLPLALALALLAAAAVHADPALDRAKQVLDRSILFDGHNDLPNAIHDYKDAPGDIAAYDLRARAPAEGQTDIPRLREGRVGAQFWSVYIPPEAGHGFARRQLEQIDLARRVIARYPDTFEMAGTAAEIRAAKQAAASAPCSASRAATPSRTRSACSAPTTTSACAT
ncbi:MAG: membrane dipeptidase [Steroidobacteraceae bacterium]